MSLSSMYTIRQYFKLNVLHHPIICYEFSLDSICYLMTVFGPASSIIVSKTEDLII